jgi:hypothetical protein
VEKHFQYMLNSPGFVTEEVYQKRFDICKKCPSILKDFICSICVCEMKSKAMVEYSKCPINKW